MGFLMICNNLSSTLTIKDRKVEQPRCRNAILNVLKSKRNGLGLGYLFQQKIDFSS